MTRKDYVMIAAALRETLDAIERESAAMAVGDSTRAALAGERLGVRHAALRVMEALASDNPRFERETFLKACGFYA